MKSSISNAVVLESTVTGFSVGAAGVLMLAHSSTMVFAWAGRVSAAVIATAGIRLRFMNILLDGRLLTNACGSDHAQAMRVRQSGDAAPRLLKHRRPAQYCKCSGYPSTRAPPQINRRPEGTVL